MIDYSHKLSELQAQGRLRSFPTRTSTTGLLHCSGNDYLALSTSHSLRQEFLAELPSTVALGSCASRLLMPRQEVHTSLESLLAQAYGKEVLLFNSGYHANTGCVSALASESDTLIVADKLVHASIIDGITLSKAPYKRFPHNDIAALRRILTKERGDYSQYLIVVESIYSMDGDTAPLAQIVALKEEFPDLLIYVDEAHAFGVRGPKGLGLCEELGLISQIDIIIGTLGKAAASMGAFAVTTPTLRQYLLNTARSFIFSTALPPICIAWSEFIVRKIFTMQQERSRLQEISSQLKTGIEQLTGKECVSTSQIIPLIIGDSCKAVAISREMEALGVLALPIRRPTVAAGTERIRISLNAAMSSQDVCKILTVAAKALSSVAL